MSTAVKSSVLARAQRGGGNAQGPGPIDRFLDAVWMERGLSPNTLAAYRADLTALERWLDQHESELTAAKRGDLLSFMAWRVQAGARPRSTARASRLLVLMARSEAALVRIAGATISDSTANGLDSTAIV